jgi:hypothetical protein
MYRVPRFGRGIAGWRGVLALSFSALAVICVIFWSQAGPAARANDSSEYASYPALASTAPSGLPLVASHEGGGSGGPTWPIEAPEGVQGGWPISSSIRAVSVGAPGMSAWIAKSIGGGVCVLLWVHQPADAVPSVASSCTTDAEGLSRGATTQLSQLPDSPGEVYVAGVVPSGVSSMDVTLADGSVQSVPVTDGAWALQAEGEPTGYRAIQGGNGNE